MTRKLQAIHSEARIREFLAAYRSLKATDPFEALVEIATILGDHVTEQQLYALQTYEQERGLDMTTRIQGLGQYLKEKFKNLYKIAL
ncbi:hypothetical protein GCM10027051_31480 [Niabella terrae]